MRLQPEGRDNSAEMIHVRKTTTTHLLDTKTPNSRLFLRPAFIPGSYPRIQREPSSRAPPHTQNRQQRPLTPASSAWPSPSWTRPPAAPSD